MIYDPFKDRFKKMNPRKMIRMWCEKELFNLKLLLKAGIPCPEPVCIKKHILFMRFIGDKGNPSLLKYMHKYIFGLVSRSSHHLVL